MPVFNRHTLPGIAFRTTLRGTAAAVLVTLMLAAGHLANPDVRKHEPAPDISEGSPLAQAEMAANISHRYRVDYEKTLHIVRQAYTQASRQGVDPILVLGIIATESSFREAAISHAGAVGLMQVMPNVHKDNVLKIAGNLGLQGRRAAEVLKHPEANIMAGIEVLKTCAKRSRGDLRQALLRYNGSLRIKGSRYADDVMANTERLRGCCRMAAAPIKNAYVVLDTR